MKLYYLKQKKIKCIGYVYDTAAKQVKNIIRKNQMTK